MNKKILIGSMLVFTMLLLMPSISAININAIENQIKTEYEELPLNDDIDFEIPDKLPLLYLIVFSIGFFRTLRGMRLFEYSIEYDDYWSIIAFVHPFLLLRSIILMVSGSLWINGWYIISEILGLDWDFSIFE